MAPFHKAVSVRPSTTGSNRGNFKAYTGNIDSGWSASAVPNGGYVLALLVEACIQHQSATIHKDPIHVTAHYLRATSSAPFEIQVRMVKNGKRFTNLAAELMQKGEIRVATHMVFGTNAPFPTQRMRFTIDPPSPYARQIPLHDHPSKATPVALRDEYRFSQYVKVTTDPVIEAKNATDSPTRTTESTVGGGGLEWGGWLEFLDKDERITSPSMAFLVDVFENVVRLLPKEVRGGLHGSWFPTMVLSLEFKSPIPPPASDVHAARTVGIYSVGRFVNDPDHRHDSYVEVWTAPSNIGEGAEAEGWRRKQVCLATATQMSLTVPVEVNERKRAKL
ncbi:hypothetical protein AX15_000194 [Amanita polypyramis BW_CC]|nr:hypothetical protein AX15_000194 [Amanita polypyramis BW_CC]